jgi:hypothetical protein
MTGIFVGRQDASGEIVEEPEEKIRTLKTAGCGTQKNEPRASTQLRLLWNTHTKAHPQRFRHNDL